MAFRDAAAGEFPSRQTDLVGREISRYLNGTEAVDIRAVHIAVTDHVAVDGAVRDHLPKDLHLEILRLIVAVTGEGNGE